MNIKFYSTMTCPYCKLVRSYLQEKQLEYTEIDVAYNKKEADNMVRLTGQMGVPVLDVDGRVIVGWNRQALDEVIKSS